MIRGSVLVVLFAACGSDPGIYLEVHGDPAMREVDVYLGKAECTTAQGPCAIAPPSMGKLAPASDGTWYRDANTSFTAGASGGTARVHVRASGPDEIVQLVVLGKDEQGQVIASTVIHDVAVPTSQAVDVSATLYATAAIDTAEESMQPHPDGAYALVWTSDNAPTECVLVESWQGGMPTRTFVVPENDEDCDGFPTVDGSGQRNTLECDAFWYDFSPRLASSSKADCATVDVVDGLHSCLLGGAPCTDGTGPGTTCVQVAPTTCLPQAVCSSACAQIESTASLSTCVPTSGTTTELVCTFYGVGDAGTPCTNFTKPTGGKITLDGLFANSSRTCNSVAFSPTDTLANPVWQDAKLFPPAPSTAEIDLVARGTGACDFDAMWKDGTLAMGQSPQHALADITVDNGRHVWLPVRLVYQPCLAATSTELGFSCVYSQAATESAVNCAR